MYIYIYILIFNILNLNFNYTLDFASRQVALTVDDFQYLGLVIWMSVDLCLTALKSLTFVPSICSHAICLDYSLVAVLVKVGNNFFIYERPVEDEAGGRWQGNPMKDGRPGDLCAREFHISSRVSNPLHSANVWNVCLALSTLKIATAVFWQLSVHWNTCSVVVTCWFVACRRGVTLCKLQCKENTSSRPVVYIIHGR